MALIGDTECCGLGELDGIANTEPRIIIKHFCEATYTQGEWDGYAGGVGRMIPSDFNYALVLFTSVTKRKYGERLRDYIIKNKLGYVTKSATKTNPNTKNRINAWLWAIHVKNLEQWYKKNKNKK
ncbi:hypothetical protein LCGC14_2820730 [marine sediment metagenome]|uniref:Uncharacterized protein n=1 Tax=marine sediment metagenome TaxID=412755 RepID=A0A0F8YGX8_9ZZZZ